MTHFGLFLEPEFWDQTLKNALKAEELGFSSIWLDDHLLNFNQINPENRLEAWTTLSALAAKTTKIKLGNLVLCNSFRNPALLGKMVATLDVISNGRIELGIGAGWYETEYFAYGFPYYSAGTRIDRLRESLQIITQMFTEEKFSFAGKYWQLENNFCEPKPVQKPFPIWVGGTGPKSTRVAVECASGINVTTTDIDQIKTIFHQIEDQCETLNRNYSHFNKSLFTRVHLTSNEAERKEVIQE